MPESDIIDVDCQTIIELNDDFTFKTTHKCGEDNGELEGDE